MKIVIIDDDAMSMENLELTLEMDLSSFEICLYKFPEEFINEEINIEQVVLIILDVMFAGDGENVGGFDMGLTFYLKFKNENPLIPIIILTNRTKTSIKTEILAEIENNGDLIFEKPQVSVPDIISNMKRLLNIDKEEETKE